MAEYATWGGNSVISLVKEDNGKYYYWHFKKKTWIEDEEFGTAWAIICGFETPSRIITEEEAKRIMEK